MAGDRPALRDRPDSHGPPRLCGTTPLDMVIGALEFINEPKMSNGESTTGLTWGEGS